MSWEVRNLNEVCDFQRGLTYKKSDEVEFSKNAILRSNNVDLKTNQLNYDEIKYINDNITINDSKKVKRGSLLICMANGSKSHLGKVALIEDEIDFAFGGFMGLITPKKVLNSKFLFYNLISEHYKKFIASLSDGANINNLKFSQFNNFAIPVPPLSEQQEIVERLDAVYAQTDLLQQKYTQKLASLEELRKSVLERAFRGEIIIFKNE